MLKMGSANINATSRIGEMDVAYFNASFSLENNGNYSISKNIINITAYEENKEICDADYELFEQKAKKMIEQAKVILN